MLDTSDIYELMDSQPIILPEESINRKAVEAKATSKNNKKRKQNEATAMQNIKRANKVQQSASIEIREIEPGVREIGLFPITTTPPMYVEKDVDVDRIAITENFYVSYNVKDVTKTGGSKGRIEVYQINRKYTSKEGEPKVFSMKINGNEIQNTIRALTYLVNEAIKRAAQES